MSRGSDELEFISVQHDDEESMLPLQNGNIYKVDSSADDSVIGSWLLKQSKHPSALFFHLLFKALALFFYIFGSWFTSNFIFTFVVCIILLAFDFWTVKNISGRLLVGLRWWSYVRDDGSNEWVFESLEDMAELSPFDSRVFWGALYVTPLIWSFFFFVGVLRLKFEYLPVIITAIVMSGANIVGYMKCSNSAKSKMKSIMEQSGSLSVLENSAVRGWLFNTLLGGTVVDGNKVASSG